MEDEEVQTEAEESEQRRRWRLLASIITTNPSNMANPHMSTELLTDFTLLLHNR